MKKSKETEAADIWVMTTNNMIHEQEMREADNRVNIMVEMLGDKKGVGWKRKRNH